METAASAAAAADAAAAAAADANDSEESDESANLLLEQLAASRLNDWPEQEQQQQQQEQQELQEEDVEPQVNKATNNKGQAGLLEHAASNSLYVKLHLSGMQKASLPPEFTPACITSILLTAKSLFGSEASCLQLDGPLVLFGDLHGEFHVLTKLADVLGRPPARSYLFLGDYVDRGKHSLETLLYLMLMKLQHPHNVFILRGNHEDRRVYRFFNFEDDLVRAFGLSQGQNLSGLFHTVLCYLPVCAIVNREIFCCHGGLSPQFNHQQFAADQDDLVKRINQLPKPVLFRKSDFVADLLWADPLELGGSRMPNLQRVGFTTEEWIEHRLRVIESSGCGEAGRLRQPRPTAAPTAKLSTVVPPDADPARYDPPTTTIDWMPNPRGCSYVFSQAAFAQFLKRYRLHWMVRGHMFVSNGTKESFEGRCVTLFSAADYAQKYRNVGAVICVAGGATGGRQFPGRVMRFSKASLLRYSGQLPPETAKWPQEIVGGAKGKGSRA